MVDNIKIRGARVHNLKNIDVDIPLGKIVSIAGVSGSGKSSLALGVLYAEGSRRYLEALSTYNRRRITQHSKAKVDSIEHVPASLALNQRPNIPGIRSTFGTSSELLNSIRLMFSRCGKQRCPNGHHVDESVNIARELPLECHECGVEFYGLSAEEYSFNSDGACPKCSGTGIIRDVDISSLVPDKNLTLEDGAVKPWTMFGLSSMYLVAKELGVRVDVPFKNLTDKEKNIVYHGDAVTKKIFIPTNGKAFDVNFTYRNAIEAVRIALDKAQSEKGLTRINKYLKTQVCDECHGTRLNKNADSTLFNGLTLSQVCSMSLDEASEWIDKSIKLLPDNIQKIAIPIYEEFTDNANILLELGLGYLTLDRPSSTLSTGELQRVQLARTVRNQTTGILYVLDEPSIGLHPANIDGLIKLVNRLKDDGNSIIIVDHDTRILKIADYLIEIGPDSGYDGGNIITQAAMDEVINDENSIIAPYITGDENIIVRDKKASDEIFDEGIIKLSTDRIHTVKELDLDIAKCRLNVVTGVSGSGKTTLILESLYPAILNSINNEKLPSHIKSIDTCGITKIYLIDSSPIGKNVRSTLATYSGVFSNIRKLYSQLDKSIENGYTLKDFSYNTGSLRCSTCNGTGQINLDVQFLPDVEITCPDCEGLRFSNKADEILYNGYSIKDLMALTVDEAIDIFEKEKKILNKLRILSDMGLGYLTLGEATPSLSGGEAQRLKLSSQMNKKQDSSLFIFDEPTIGLHPRDVKKLIGIFDKLIENNATIVVIEHDLDLIKNADYIIDMGPKGGVDGGRIVAEGTLDEIISNDNSITAKYLK